MAGNDPNIFARNLEKLRRRWPEVALAIERSEPSEGVAIVESRSGEPTLRVVSEAGQAAWLHSRFRPAEEARRQVEDLELDSNDSVVIFGFGLGYAVLELVRRVPSTTFIVVVEKDPAVLRRALECRPLGELLERLELDILVGATKEELFERFDGNVNRLFGGKLRLLTHPASKQAFPAYYEMALKTFGEFTLHGAVAVRSALYLSRVTIENQFSNLPEYMASPGIEFLAGRFAGYPAVVVGAGPSLERNVEELRRAEGRAVIIAVSTAMKVLLARGIRPDLTAIIDYHNISARYFESIDPETAPPIICDPKANTMAILAYPGVKLFGNDPLMNTLLGGVPGDKGKLMMSATVAHAAFDIAAKLGCDPIITVGLDLSYPQGRHHVGGTALQTQQFRETNRFYTFEMKEVEWCFLNRKRLLEVPAIGGGTVQTSDIFLSYLKEFEALFANARARVIDATEGGALKRGTEVRPLREALAEHAVRALPEDVGRLARAAAAAVDVERAYAQTVAKLRERLAEAEGLANVYRKTIRLLRKVVKINEEGRAADDLVLRVLPLKEKFSQYGFLYHFLNNFAQADLFIRFRRDREIIGEKLSGVEKQARQAQRDLDYVRALSKALEYVQEKLREAVSSCCP